MSGIFEVGKKLFDKLLRKPYRSAFVAEHVRRGIAYQIRALRDQRGWNQKEFSKRLKKPQSVVSRLEDPSYGKVTMQTLLEVATVFDVALQVRFVPYSSFLVATQDLGTASMRVPSFETELASPLKIISGSEVEVGGQIAVVEMAIPDERVTAEAETLGDAFAYVQ